jgi:hypothetical protein
MENILKGVTIIKNWILAAVLLLVLIIIMAVAAGTSAKPAEDVSIVFSHPLAPGEGCLADDDQTKAISTRKNGKLFCEKHMTLTDTERLQMMNTSDPLKRAFKSSH